MKTIFALTLWAAFALVLPAHTAAETLAIYLVTQSNTNLADNVLAPSALLADGDFVAYNTNTHAFWITAEAAQKVQHDVTQANNPFVIVANGERIYKGDFKMTISSTLMVGYPTIDFFQGRGQTNFFINQAIVMPEAPPGTQLIGGTSTNFLVLTEDGKTNVIECPPTPDVRNDPRILGAIRKLALPAEPPGNSL